MALDRHSGLVSFHIPGILASMRRLRRATLAAPRIGNGGDHQGDSVRGGILHRLLASQLPGDASAWDHVRQRGYGSRTALGSAVAHILDDDERLHGLLHHRARARVFPLGTRLAAAACRASHTTDHLRPKVGDRAEPRRALGLGRH